MTCTRSSRGDQRDGGVARRRTRQYSTPYASYVLMLLQRPSPEFRMQRHRRRRSGRPRHVCRPTRYSTSSGGKRWRGCGGGKGDLLSPRRCLSTLQRWQATSQRRGPIIAGGDVGAAMACSDSQVMCVQAGQGPFPFPFTCTFRAV